MLDDLRRHLGVPFTPLEVRITRWPGAFAQYRPHHHALGRRRRGRAPGRALRRRVELSGHRHSGMRPDRAGDRPSRDRARALVDSLEESSPWTVSDTVGDLAVDPAPGGAGGRLVVGRIVVVVGCSRCDVGPSANDGGDRPTPASPATERRSRARPRRPPTTTTTTTTRRRPRPRPPRRPRPRPRPRAASQAHPADRSAAGSRGRRRTSASSGSIAIPKLGIDAALVRGDPADHARPRARTLARIGDAGRDRQRRGRRPSHEPRRRLPPPRRARAGRHRHVHDRRRGRSTTP